MKVYTFKLYLATHGMDEELASLFTIIGKTKDMHQGN